MRRIHLALLAAALCTTGCGLFRNDTCCNDRPGWFSRFRLANRNGHDAVPVVVYPGGGDCCDNGHGITGGPVLPPGNGNVLPAPNPGIPRIEENGKQMPWDPKTGRNGGTKTGTQVNATKGGI